MVLAIYLLAVFNTFLLISVTIDVARIKKKMIEKIRLIEKEDKNGNEDAGSGSES